MTRIIIDCHLFSCRQDVHQAFAEALSFPDYYGSNLDALHDCLTEIGTDTQILLLHWEWAAKHMENYCKILKNVLAMCCRENPHLHIEYC